jgi:hypothetical protein
VSETSDECAAWSQFFDPGADGTPREPRTKWKSGPGTDRHCWRLVPITVVWGAITIAGWSVLDRHVKLAATLSSPCFAKLPNPFQRRSHHQTQANLHPDFADDLVFALIICRLAICDF